MASTPTAWRAIERTARDASGLARLRAARAHARGRAWAAGGDPQVELLVIDADATLVLAHTDAKEGAAGTYKHPFGFAPLLAYLDRGAAPGEPLAGILRAGNAAAGAARDLIELVDLALAQLPGDERPVLVRSDSAAASTRLAWHLRERGVGFSLGMPIDAHVREAILAQPEPAWTPAVDPDGQPRKGAEVVELTGWVDLHTWPEGTRAICRREDAHPGAQLRFTDHDGHRFQVFLTDQPDPELARLELRHRQRARIEDRIRAAKATGSRTCRSTAGAATTSGWSWSWPPRTSPAGPRRCCWTVPRRGRAQDAALPAAPRGGKGGAPRPPSDPAAATQLALGGPARQGVHAPAPCRCAADAATMPVLYVAGRARPSRHALTPATTTRQPSQGAADHAQPVNQPPATMSGAHPRALWQALHRHHQRLNEKPRLDSTAPATEVRPASWMPRSRALVPRTTTYLTEDSGSGSLGLPPKPGSKDQPCPPAT